MAKKVINKKVSSTTKKATTSATKKVATKKPTVKRKARVRVNKLTKPIQSKELVEIECRDCGAPSLKSKDVISFVCWQCVHEACGDQELPKEKRATGFPRGWAFMKEFVHKDGRVYHKGVEQPKLKGTKKPTAIKATTAKPKKSKIQKAREKQELLVKYTELKKQIKKEKRVTYRRKLESQLRKIEKQL